MIEEYSPVEIAEEQNEMEVVELLERFRADPVQTRQEIRLKLGHLQAEAV